MLRHSSKVKPYSSAKNPDQKLRIGQFPFTAAAEQKLVR